MVSYLRFRLAAQMRGLMAKREINTFIVILGSAFTLVRYRPIMSAYTVGLNVSLSHYRNILRLD